MKKILFLMAVMLSLIGSFAYANTITISNSIGGDVGYHTLGMESKFRGATALIKVAPDVNSLSDIKKENSDKITLISSKFEVGWQSDHGI